MISISSKVFKSLINKIGSSSDECCGFLLGKSMLDINRVDSFYEVENYAEGDKSKIFEISSKDYLKTEKYATELGLNIMGVYHTHLNHPADPSELDRKFAFPEFSNLIISFVDFTFFEVKSWKIDSDRNFFEENISFN
jgi:proteasome lid subunit RPN8/RPN11